jgi:alkylhydroperoxidase family enzyme
MARVPYVETASLPEADRALAPENSHIFRAFAHSRLGLRRYRAMTKYIREETQLDPRLREMALIQVGYAARCAYEYTHHIKTGLRHGVTPDDIRAIADETAGKPTHLTPLEKAVLAATRGVTTGFDFSDEVFEELRRGLGYEQVLELLFSVATYNGTVRMLTSLRVDLEDEYRHYLEEFPIR